MFEGRLCEDWYPNTGDLTNPGFRRLARDGYSLDTVETISHNSQTMSQLLKFASIRAGDFIVIPADEELHEVHFGLVLTKDRKKVPLYFTQRPIAYYYDYNIANGDFYECAHRVNVQWARQEDGQFAKIYVPEIGGVWRMAFGELHKSSDKLNSFVRAYHFW